MKIFRPKTKTIVGITVFMGALVFLYELSLAFNYPHLTGLKDTAVIAGLFFFIVGGMAIVTYLQAIKIHGGKLTCRNDFFIASTFDIQEIEKIKVHYGGLIKFVRFYLVDGSKKDATISTWENETLVSLLKSIQTEKPQIDLEQKYQKAIERLDTKDFVDEALKSSELKLLVRGGFWFLLALVIIGIIRISLF